MELAVAVCLVAFLATIGRGATIVLDGSARTQVYDGHGALSAGASSRLLVDYSEPQRSEILDYLFLPNFGASLHLIKVEIGGDVQSTDGTEASHIHSLDPPLSSCNQGYEFWLLQEAKRRNPAILTYALSWGVPGWVGNGTYYSTANIDYHIEFMNCVRDTYDIMLDYMGIWNERQWGTPSWVKQFRAAMDAAGYSGTRIVIPDGWLDKKLEAALQDDSEFLEAVAVVGLHYPCHTTAPQILQLGLKFWSSEDYSTVGDWAGAGCWGRLFNQNFLRMNMTSTIAWSLIWSVYPDLPYYGNGLMYAYEPWSNYYTVNYPIWTSAHTCQFTAPGWVYLGSNYTEKSSVGSGYLPGGGSFVTLVPPTVDPSPTLGKNTVATSSGGDFTLVIEKLEGKCLRCPGQETVTESLDFQLSGGLGGYPDSALKATSLRFFCTNSTAPFLQHPDVEIKRDGTLTVEVQGDSICTLSTTVGAKRGSHADPPTSQPFPNNYTTDFSDFNNISQQALYFTDQGGSFVIFMEPKDNPVLKQVSVEPPGHNQWGANPFPTTMIGSAQWNGNVTSGVKIAFDKPTWPSYDTELTAGICNNVPASGWVRGAKASPAGVCLMVARQVSSSTGSNGTMSVIVNSAKGPLLQYQHALDVPFSPSWFSLSLSVNGDVVNAEVNQQAIRLSNCSDCLEFTSGYVALTSGWNMATFDDFSVVSPPPPKPLKNSWVRTISLSGVTRRNDFDGYVGGLIQPTSSVQVTALGRHYGLNNGLSEHQVSIISASTNKTIASTTVTASAQNQDALGFSYATLASAVTLETGQEYYLVSMEKNGSDYFFGSGGPNPKATTVPSLSLLQSVYYFQDAWHIISNSDTMYGPLNLLLA